MQSVPITTKVVSSNPAHGEVTDSNQNIPTKYVGELCPLNILVSTLISSLSETVYEQ